jgi:hypothetical protein
VVFAPETLASFMLDGKKLLVEPEPMLVDHLAICHRGVWSRDGEATGVETTEKTETKRG